MIKNVIFDLGRVLISWEPLNYLLENFEPEKAEMLYKKVFDIEDWNAMDKGLITEKELFEKKKKLYPELSKETEKIENEILGILQPIEENVALLPKLKSAGYKLYVLSNFSRGSFEYVRNKFDFFNYFDGIIVSSHHLTIKPEEKIYRILLETYNLVPEECLFIDDKAENVLAASKFGIHTIHLADHRLLKEELCKVLKFCE